MTTNWYARTRFVNIKEDYSMDDARNCWWTEVVSNANLECFNPNKYRIKAVEIMLKIWWSNYYFKPKNWEPTTISEKKADTTWATTYYCYWWNDYMTAMRSDHFPRADGSDATRVRLWKSYCWETRREVWWRSGASYMNYSTQWTF